jgi:hypothetical protein
MTRSCVALSLAALALTVLPAATPAQTAAAAVGVPFRMALAEVVNDGVLDDAQLFSPETVKAARDRIHQIRKTYHCAVLIDTVNRAPASDTNLADWAKERSQELGVEGIHVLICKEPLRVVVVTWPERFEATLMPRERTRIEGLLTRGLRKSPIERLLARPPAKPADKALLMALDEIGADLKKHLEPEPPTVPFGPLAVFFIGTIGVWLLLSVVRLRLQKPEPFSFTGEPQKVRLTAGLLAGMFGNPCGYWITDRLFPHERAGSAAGIVFEETPPAEPATPTEELLHGSPGDETGSLAEHAEIKQE